MKYLFIVQGEGRGHLTQALTLEERLRAEGHEVVEVLVGKSRQRKLPAFFEARLHAPLRRFESPNFLPAPADQRNKLGRSVAYNLTRLGAFARSVAFIRRRIRETGAEVVVNFYELLTGLTWLFCAPRGVRHVCIGHQYLFLHPDFRLPPGSSRGQLLLLRLFTQLTAVGACRKLALSFSRMADAPREGICVVPPLLRREVMQLPSEGRGDYVLGYMVNAGFAAQVRTWHRTHPYVPLRFFWDNKGERIVRREDATLSFHPLDDWAFLEAMAGCKAYATTAGFESICEAMYLGKPVLMVPAHIEQECNAYDAARAGAGIVSDSFELDRLLTFCRTYRPDPAFVFWANDTALVTQRLTEAAWDESPAPHRETLMRRILALTRS